MVCMESDPYSLEGVRPLTAATFARIGVKIAWHTLDACPVGVDAIQVRLSRDPTSVRNASTQALAAAQPYARTIIVFLDRVKEVSRNRGISVMPNVLVHEITHILEGINRHSATGVMKARWDDKDYFAMRCKPLDFAAEDVILIYAGLKIPRATEAAVAAQ
jgi:flagellar basal body rod protein FlgC